MKGTRISLTGLLTALILRATAARQGLLPAAKSTKSAQGLAPNDIVRKLPIIAPAEDLPGVPRKQAGGVEQVP